MEMCIEKTESADIFRHDACSNNVLMMHINISAAFHSVKYWTWASTEPFTVNAAFIPQTQYSCSGHLV